jgi:integrase
MEKVVMQAPRVWGAAADAQAPAAEGVGEEVHPLLGVNQLRWQGAIKDRAFGPIRGLIIVETRAEQLLAALTAATVSTNVFLRKLHNFCQDMNWLPWPIIPKKQWPPVHFGPKRAITLEEHLKILAREGNPERKAFYELAWHLGASQTNIALLEAENIDWEQRVVSYARKKTGELAFVHFGDEIAELLRTLPQSGPLFPYMRRVRAGDRATEFKQRCRGLGITGVTLHSYRYAWAERARTCGYPERFAQEALGHNSKAVHRAYARHAKVVLPSLESFEKQAQGAKILPFPGTANPVPAPQVAAPS